MWKAIKQYFSKEATEERRAARERNAAEIEKAKDKRVLDCPNCGAPKYFTLKPDNLMNNSAHSQWENCWIIKHECSECAWMKKDQETWIRMASAKSIAELADKYGYGIYNKEEVMKQLGLTPKENA